MTREEAVNWIINISADIGKIQHQDLWHYEQALAEIKDMLEAEPEQKMGRWIDLNATDRYKRVKVYDHFECSICHERSSNDSKYCPNCGAKMEVEE